MCVVYRGAMYVFVKCFIIFELETVALVPTKTFYPSFPQRSGPLLVKGFCRTRPRARFHSSHHDQNLLSNKFIHKFSDYPIVYTHTHTHSRICTIAFVYMYNICIILYILYVWNMRFCFYLHSIKRCAMFADVICEKIYCMKGTSYPAIIT